MIHNLSLLARAHYSWASHDFQQVGDMPMDPHAGPVLEIQKRQALKRGAWHLARIGLVLNQPAEVIVDAAGLTDTDRRQQICNMVAGLLNAATIWRAEGNLHEADDLVVDALEWRSQTDAEGRQALIETAAHQLWQNYWLGGNPSTRAHLATLVMGTAELLESPAWWIHQRYETLLSDRHGSYACKPTGQPIPAYLENRARLCEALLWIRQHYGFEQPALKDDRFSVAEPLPVAGDPLAEFGLCSLAAAANLERGEVGVLASRLGEWPRRLEAIAGAADQVGARAVADLHEARRLHLLADAYQRAQERSGEAEDTALEAPSATSDGSVDIAGPVPEEVWERSQEAYQRCLQVAGFLGWRPVAIEASWGLGCLLLQHTPEKWRTEAPPWWGRWDELFRTAISLEGESGWILYQPEIHRSRFSFFKEKALEHSVEDAYNTLKSVQQARYPRQVVLEWHDRVRTLLNNYGDSASDRQRSAELYEEWAWKLCSLPEASGFRKFERIECEQAHSLLFAAQAKRLLGKLGEALRLLDDAEALLKRSKLQEPAELGVAERQDQMLRDLRISLCLQRAWLFQDQERHADAEAITRELWQDSRREDRDAVLVLRTLLGIESKGGLLSAVWPPTPDDPCHSDPGNTDHSLPDEWFEGPKPLKLETRFDFRFRQLLRLISIISNSKIPIPIEFSIAARLHWMWLGGDFADTALTFGERGLQTRHGASTRALIVGLLEEVRTYYREIDAVDRKELEALRLLMAYTESPDHYRFDYERVLYERQALLTREIRVLMEGEGSAGWLRSALKVRDFLGVLVDPDRQTRARDRALSRTGLSVQEYQCLVERKNETLKQAEAALERDDYNTCQDLLTPLLPSLNTTPWVRSEDLSAIDLWLRCARRTGQGDPSTVRSNLRRLALTYVRQFPAVVPDGQIQQVAMQFVRTIEEAGQTVPQAPRKG